MDEGGVEVRDDVAQHRFEVFAGGELAGFTVYRRGDGPVPFVHTEIAEAFEHRGLASALIGAALDAMRAEGRQVLPECPFVRSYIERHPDYVDLVPAARRAAYGLATPGP